VALSVSLATGYRRTRTGVRVTPSGAGGGRRRYASHGASAPPACHGDSEAAMAVTHDFQVPTFAGLGILINLKRYQVKAIMNTVDELALPVERIQVQAALG
jgi:hypothetical protein